MILKFKNHILEKSCKIKYEFNGMQIVEFELNQHDHINCEDVFVLNNNQYIVKSIDDTFVTAELDLQDLKNTMIIGKRKFDSLRLSLLLPELTTWKIKNAQTNSLRRTLEIEDCSIIEALNQVQKLYGITFNFNCLKKEITVIDEAINNHTIFAKDINIKNFSIKQDSYEFYTRIYAFGKNGLTFEDLNNNKNYVEDFTFSDKVVERVFRDDRFTTKEGLLKHAKELLEEYARPTIEYTLDVVDLNLNNPLKLHDEIIFLNHKTNKKEYHRVIELVEYTEDSRKNEIKLLNKSKNIIDYLTTIETKVMESVKEIKHTVTTLFDSDNTMLSELIKQKMDTGHAIFTDTGIYIVDRLPKEEARNVVQIGLGGILTSINGFNGPYSLAISSNGEMNADKITSGTLHADRIAANSLTIRHLDNEFNSKLQQIEHKVSDAGIETIISAFIERNKDNITDGMAAQLRNMQETISNLQSGVIEDKSLLAILNEKQVEIFDSVEAYKTVATESIQQAFGLAEENKNNIEKITTTFRQTVDGAEIVNGNFKTVFKGNEWAIYDSGKKVMYIDNQRLVITSGVFMDKLFVGNHVFVKDNIRKTTKIRWTGALFG